MSNPRIICKQSADCVGTEIECEDLLQAECRIDAQDQRDEVLNQSICVPVKSNLEDQQDGALGLAEISYELCDENAVDEKGYAGKNYATPGHVEGEAIVDSSSSLEWIVSVDPFQQIFQEIPDDRQDCFDVGIVQCSGEVIDQSKMTEAFFLKNDMPTADSSCTLIDSCSSVQLLERTCEHVSLGNPDLELFSASTDAAGCNRHDMPYQFKFDNSDLLHSIEIENNLDISEESDFHSEQSIQVKVEPEDSSQNSLAAVQFENLNEVMVYNEQVDRLEQEFSIMDYEKVSSAADMCQTLSKSNDKGNGDISLEDACESCEVNDDSALYLGEAVPESRSGLSPVALLLETQSLQSDVEVVPHVLLPESRDFMLAKNLVSSCVTPETLSAESALEDEYDKQRSKEIMDSSRSFVLSCITGYHNQDKRIKPPSAQTQSNIVLNLGNNAQPSRRPLVFLKRLSVPSDGDQDDDEAPPKKKLILLRKQPTLMESTGVIPAEDNPSIGEPKVGDEPEVKKFVCSHAGCGWSFPTTYKLKRHEEVHKGRKDFVCNFEGCNRKFTTIYNLKTHMKLHKMPCTEICPQPNCTESFRNKRLLEKHMRIHTNGEKTIACPHPGCTKMFVSHTSIGTHTRVHQHESELVCAFDGCGRKFDKLSRLKQHMRSHTGERPYRCTVEGCNWAFTTSSKLCRHLRMHSGQKKWQCPFPDCGKLFTRAEHVRGHMVTHTDFRPFLCSVQGCGARFKSKNSLDIHLKRHNLLDRKTKGFVLSCPFEGCAQRFVTKAQLEMHLDRHHLNDSSQDPDSVAISTPCELFPMMISLDLDNLDNIVQNQRASLASSIDHSVMLDRQSAGVVCSTASALNLLTLPVLVSSESAPLNLVSSSTTTISDVSLVSPKPNQVESNIILNVDEIMTPHAISFRDPETGTVYVQTQLLQDDPPTADMYLDDDNDESDLTLTAGDHPPMIEAELTSMLHDDFNNDGCHEIAFTGTTINLQDLE